MQLFIGLLLIGLSIGLFIIVGNAKRDWRDLERRLEREGRE